MFESLSSEGMLVDVKIRKVLNELLDMENEFKKQLKAEQNPIKEEELKNHIQKVEELIGRIRFESLDEMGILGEDKEENEEITKTKGKLDLSGGYGNFENIPLENKDRIGENAKIIEKEAMSTMAPLILKQLDTGKWGVFCN